MRKMEAESIPDLVMMGMKLGVRHANSFRVEFLTKQHANDIRTKGGVPASFIPGYSSVPTARYSDLL